MYSGADARASACTRTFRLASERARTLATSGSGPTGSTPPGSISSSVVSTPRSAKTEANSHPTTPPPITATRWPSAGRLVAWSELMTRSPSNSKPGSDRGSEPVAMITPRLPTRTVPSTATAPSGVSRPCPLTTVTFRLASRPVRPRASRSTMPDLRSLIFVQSGR